MSKTKTARDVQVRERRSGASLLGVKDPIKPTMAIDAAPRAGDPAKPRSIGITNPMASYSGMTGPDAAEEESE